MKSETRMVEISWDLFLLIQSELLDLGPYQWDNDSIPRNDCGSKSLMEFEHAWEAAEEDE